MSERYKTTRIARFTSIPYVERGDRDRILAEGTRREQVHLAMQRDLSPKHAERLTNTEDEASAPGTS